MDGPDEIIFGVHHPLALRIANHHLRIQRNQCGRTVGRIDSHASVGIQNRMLAIDGGGRICKADVAACAIALPSAAIIPAAGVLGDVAADGALIADLRRGCGFRACRENAELFPHHRMAHHFGKRGHGADLQASVHLAHAAQLGNLAQIDHHLGTFDAVLQPVEGV